MRDPAPQQDGGRVAARGFQYQYLRTLESMLDIVDDERVHAIRVEGDPNSTQETVDFDLMDADGACLLAVQVKSKSPGGTVSAPELFKVLCRLVTQQDSSSYEIWTNAAPGSGALRLNELLAEESDLEDLREQLRILLARADRRLSDLQRLTDAQLHRLRQARVRFDDREPFEVRADLREQLRGFRNRNRASLGDRSAGLLTGYLVAEILHRAADGRQATWSREEARQALLIPDEAVARAAGVRDWGVVVGPMPAVPDIPRSEWLEQLRTVFSTTKQRAVRQAVLVGHSGIGKSSLAAGYVADRADDYDVIFWLDAESEASLAASFRTALIHLRGPEFTNAISGEPTQLREQLRTELARHVGRWAMIFDNPSRATEVAPWIPSVGAGDILITTLDATSAPRQGTVFEIGPMSLTEATELVRKRLTSPSRPIATEQLVRLAETVERWPLAIELLCGYLTTCGIEMGALDDFFGTVRQRSMDDAASIPAGYPRTVVSAVKLCLEPFYQQWLAAPGDLDAGRPIAFMMAISMLASQRIPVHLLGAALLLNLEEARKHSPDNGPLYLEAPALELHEVLRSLRSYSLIAFDEDLSPFHPDDPTGLARTIRVNSIVQEILQTHYDPIPNPIAMLEGLAIHLNLWLVSALGSGRWQRVDLILPHTQALLRSLTAYQVISPSIILLIINMGLVKRLSGNYEVAEESWRLCIHHMFEHEELREDALAIQVLTKMVDLRLSRPDRSTTTIDELRNWLEFILGSLQQLAPDAPELTSDLLAPVLVTLHLPQSQPILRSTVELQWILTAFDDLATRVPAAPIAEISATLTDIERRLSSPDIGLDDAEERCRALLANHQLAAINGIGLRRILIEVLIKSDRWADAKEELAEVFVTPDAAMMQVDAMIPLIQNLGLHCAGKTLLAESKAAHIASAMLGQLLDWPHTGSIMNQAHLAEQRRFDLLLAIRELTCGRVKAAEQALNDIDVAAIDEHAEEVEGGLGWYLLWQHARLRVFRDAWTPHTAI